MPPRKTTNQLNLSGTLKHNAGRYADRGEVPAVEPLQSPPPHLSGPQRSIWRQIVKLTPAGVLGECDGFAVELAVRLIERSRQGEGLKPSELSQLIGLLGRLALTPVDRQRVTIAPPPAPKSDDPWDNF